MRVAFKRTAFLEGKRYKPDSRGVEYNGPKELLPRDAEILSEDIGMKDRKDVGKINWPSPSGKGIPAVQPPEIEFEQNPPAPDQTLDQKRVPPQIVANPPSPPPTRDDIVNALQAQQDAGLIDMDDDEMKKVASAAATRPIPKDEGRTPAEKAAKASSAGPKDEKAEARAEATQARAAESNRPFTAPGKK